MDEMDQHERKTANMAVLPTTPRRMAILAVLHTPYHGHPSRPTPPRITAILAVLPTTPRRMAILAVLPTPRIPPILAVFPTHTL
jgi:hypothetical protein